MGKGVLSSPTFAERKMPTKEEGMLVAPWKGGFGVLSPHRKLGSVVFQQKTHMLTLGLSSAWFSVGTSQGKGHRCFRPWDCRSPKAHPSCSKSLALLKSPFLLREKPLTVRRFLGFCELLTISFPRVTHRSAQCC